MFAETYDPENDADEDEGAAAIFPKSDEQRTRLIESVKNILLFRSLDKEQVCGCKKKMFSFNFFLSSWKGDFMIAWLLTEKSGKFDMDYSKFREFTLERNEIFLIVIW